MYIQFNTYNTPMSVNPITTAVAWISSLVCLFEIIPQGTLTLNVNLDPLSANAYCQPMEVIQIQCGQHYTGVDENGDPFSIQFPTLEQILIDNYAAFESIRTYLYNNLMTLPQFSNTSTLMP